MPGVGTGTIGSGKPAAGGSARGLREYRSAARRRYLHVGVLLGLALNSCTAGDTRVKLVVLAGATMGTTYRLTVAGIGQETSQVTLQAGVDAILKSIDEHMSTYRDDSDVSRFNARRAVDWMDVAPEVVTVVDEAVGVSRLTGGAFDITVAPLVDLWGFGPNPPAEPVPSHGAIVKALERVGYQHIHTRRSPPALRKDRPDVEIDLSAIAKGYAVDRVAEYLESLRASSFLVEIGGELRARGRHPDGMSWKIGIEKPISDGHVIQRVVYLRDRSLATSGDYRNFRERDGKRLSHTIDPRTGRPLNHTLASVSVMERSSMRADALATGLMVLGLEGARELAGRHRLAALFIVRAAEGFREEAMPAIVPALVASGR